jgi:hypothetical protein
MYGAKVAVDDTKMSDVRKWWNALPEILTLYGTRVWRDG